MSDVIRPVGAAPIVDGLGIACAALLVYALLGPNGFRGDDSVTIYSVLVDGRTEHGTHALYLSLANALTGALQALGLSLFRALALTSAIATAIAVFVFHRAASRHCAGEHSSGGHGAGEHGSGESGARPLRPGRLTAALIAIWIALLPVVVYFATIIEIHALFLPFAAAAWYSGARYAQRPRAVTAAFIGAATACSAAIHASGHLMTLAVAAFVVGSGLRVRRSHLGHALVGGVVHAAVFALLLESTGSGTSDTAASSSKMLVRFAGHMLSHPIELMATVGYEWAWPFAPASALLVLAVFSRATRRLAVATLATTALYLGITASILGPVAVRNGAYMLPLAFPTVLVAVQWLGAVRWLGAVWRSAGRIFTLIALLAITAVFALLQRDDTGSDIETEVAAADVIEIAGDNGVVILGDHDLADRIIVEKPGYRAMRFDALRVTLVGRSFDAFDAMHQAMRAQGRRVLIDDAAVAVMEREADPLLDHLRERFTFVRVAGERFAAHRLDARGR